MDTSYMTDPWTPEALHAYLQQAKLDPHALSRVTTEYGYVMALLARARCVATTAPDTVSTAYHDDIVMRARAQGLRDVPTELADALRALDETLRMLPDEALPAALAENGAEDPLVRALNTARLAGHALRYARAVLQRVKDFEDVIDTLRGDVAEAHTSYVRLTERV